VSIEQTGEASFKEARVKLHEGLETCRVVVGTYRELLAGEEIDLDRGQRSASAERPNP
jgi:hypothetical protein